MKHLQTEQPLDKVTECLHLETSVLNFLAPLTNPTNISNYVILDRKLANEV